MADDVLMIDPAWVAWIRRHQAYIRAMPMPYATLTPDDPAREGIIGGCGLVGARQND